MKLPQDSGAPPYRLVADAIRKMIRSGRLAPGDKVPSSRELEAEYEIANMTARSSLRLLRDEGLIYSVPGRGNFVADPLPSEARPLGADRNASGEGRLGSTEYEQLSARLDELSERVDHMMSLLERLNEKRPRPSSKK
ncbi:GntR family transcriptional regulator [Streptomyces sp. NBC_01803]|uniref:GntR family transcriptional regulator n=1 Tax=Streptomyces sp. NBC_01803 TaxID=2975946 RepID=UPI002DD97847|nr:winged helix-turn-helix domain-containing protein [Streptomyces sp. NBC_01803]WSA45106.1 winged helix-turn-helix domain-containing protein [Streptomyces sp. NBC_01803]